jgi:hypothetical protein
MASNAKLTDGELTKALFAVPNNLSLGARIAKVDVRENEPLRDEARLMDNERPFSSDDAGKSPSFSNLAFGMSKPSFKLEDLEYLRKTIIDAIGIQVPQLEGPCPVELIELMVATQAKVFENMQKHIEMVSLSSICKPNRVDFSNIFPSGDAIKKPKPTTPYRKPGPVYEEFSMLVPLAIW